MTGPITIALVDDYDVVLLGVAHIIDRYRDRVIIAEIDTNKPLHDTVDIVLYDSSRTRRSRASAVTCPRLYPPATSSPPSNECTPANSSSATHPGECDPTRGSTGPDVAKASPNARPRSLP